MGNIFASLIKGGTLFYISLLYTNDEKTKNPIAGWAGCRDRGRTDSSAQKGELRHANWYNPYAGQSGHPSK